MVYGLLALLVVLLDQATKYYVNLRSEERPGD